MARPEQKALPLLPRRRADLQGPDISTDDLKAKLAKRGIDIEKSSAAISTA